MKILLLIISTSILFFAYKNINATNNKTDHYSLIKKFNNVEIRKYNQLIYASYIPIDENDRNNSFSK